MHPAGELHDFLDERFEKARGIQQSRHPVELSVAMEACLIEDAFEGDDGVFGISAAEQDRDTVGAGGIEKVVRRSPTTREDEHVRVGFDGRKMLIRLVEAHDHGLRFEAAQVGLACVRANRCDHQVVAGGVRITFDEDLSVQHGLRLGDAEAGECAVFAEFDDQGVAFGNTGTRQAIHTSHHDRYSAARIGRPCFGCDEHELRIAPWERSQRALDDQRFPGVGSGNRGDRLSPGTRSEVERREPRRVGIGLGAVLSEPHQPDGSAGIRKLSGDRRGNAGLAFAGSGGTHVDDCHRPVLGRIRASGNCDDSPGFGQRDDLIPRLGYDWHMPATRKVTVERNRLRFAAAHMATFSGECEPLHGHNYDVMIELEGELTEDAWVWDFGAVKRAARAIAEELDHHFLLQLDSPHLDMSQSGGAWRVAFGERVYSFPEGDVYPLPILNTTAECISEWFARRLLEALRVQGATHLTKLTVGIEEMPGQAGWYTVEM